MKLRRRLPKGPFEAFISYKHVESGAFARNLETAIKRYARPFWRRPPKVFRDESYIVPGAPLGEVIARALEQSGTFLYLASPEAAASPWVQDELTQWCKRSERIDNLVIVLTKGEIAYDPVTKIVDWTGSSALPSCLEGVLKTVPLYLDCRSFRDEASQVLANAEFKRAVNQIVAKLRGVDPVVLSGIEERQHRRNLATLFAFFSLVLILLIGVGVASYSSYVQQRIADERARESMARRLAAQAETDLSNFPQRALVLSAASVEATSRFDGNVETNALQALLNVLSVVGGRELTEGPTGARMVSIDAESGTVLLGDRKTGDARILYPPGKAEPFAAPPVPGGILGQSLAPGGRYAVMTNRAGLVLHCQLPIVGNDPCKVRQYSNRPLLPRMVIRLGTRGLFSTLDGDWEVRDLPTMDLIMALPSTDDLGNQILDTRLSPDGNWIVYKKRARETGSDSISRGRSDETWLVHLPSGKTTKLVDGADERGFRVDHQRFTPDGSALVRLTTMWKGNRGRRRWSVMNLDGDKPVEVDLHAQFGWQEDDIFDQDQKFDHILRYRRSEPTEVWAVRGRFGFEPVGRLENSTTWSDRSFFAVSESGHSMIDVLKNGRVRAFKEIRHPVGAQPIPLAEGLSSEQHAVASFSPNDDQVAYSPGLRSRTTYVFDLSDVSLQSGIVPRRLIGHEAISQALMFTDDGRGLTTISFTNELRYWDLNTSLGGMVPQLIFDHEGTVISAIATSADGRWTGHASNRNDFLTDTSDPQTPITLALRTQPGLTAGLEFSEDGKTLASTRHVGTLVLWRMDQIAVGQVHPAAVWRSEIGVKNFDLSKTGRYATVLSDARPADRVVLVIANNEADPTDSSRLSVSEICDIPNSVGGAVFLDGGQWLLSATQVDERTRRLIASSLSDAECAQIELDTTGFVGLNNLALSPDGHWLAHGAYQEDRAFVALRQIQTEGSSKPSLGPIIDLGEIFGATTVLRFSLDGRRLVAGDQRGDLFIWQLDGAGRMAEVYQSTHHRALTPGTNSDVADITFESSGRFMATSSFIRDNVLLWDLSKSDDQLEPVEIEALNNNVGAIAFSQNAAGEVGHLLVGRANGQLERWTIDPDTLVRQACTVAGRPLADDEVRTFLRGSLAEAPPCIQP